MWESAAFAGKFVASAANCPTSEQANRTSSALFGRTWLHRESRRQREFGVWRRCTARGASSTQRPVRVNKRPWLEHQIRLVQQQSSGFELVQSRSAVQPRALPGDVEQRDEWDNSRYDSSFVSLAHGGASHYARFERFDSCFSLLHCLSATAVHLQMLTEWRNPSSDRQLDRARGAPAVWKSPIGRYSRIDWEA